MNYTITKSIHFDRNGKQNELHEGEAPTPPTPGRVPRVTKLMALAIRLEKLVREGALRNYAEVAKLGHVTRARATQIMNLNCLAPNIQELILTADPELLARLSDRKLRPLAAELDWSKQHAMFDAITAECSAIPRQNHSALDE